MIKIRAWVQSKSAYQENLVNFFSPD